MKKYMTALMTFLVLAGISLGVHAQEKAAAFPPLERMDTAAMEKLAKLGVAHEQNRILASLIGTWDFDLKYRSGKDAEPQLSTGTVTNEMVLGNRFLSSKMIVVLNIGGENIPFEGWGFEGYDTASKAYTSVMLDKLHTGITTGAGQYDEKARTLEQKGSFTHPLRDKEGKYRSVLEFTSDDTYKRTVFITGKDGKEFKLLEIDFRKQR